MSKLRPVRRSRSGTFLLAVQGGLALAVLVLALSPASGMAAYLPLDGSGSAGALAWSHGHHAALIAKGPYEGSYIMRVAPGTTTAAALSHGALLISVPDFLCGSTARLPDIRP